MAWGVSCGGGQGLNFGRRKNEAKFGLLEGKSLFLIHLEERGSRFRGQWMRGVGAIERSIILFVKVAE